MITVDLVPVRSASGGATSAATGAGEDASACARIRVSARSIREAVDGAGGPLAVRVLFPIDGDAFFADRTPAAGGAVAGAARS